MKFDAIRIVLVATSHPGNIGATARAMKNMGLQRLYLVTPKHFPDPRAHEMSAGAYDVMDQAVITATLPEALVGCQLIFATSARPRDMDLPGHLPASCAEMIARASDDTQVAIVFGREHAGLTNAELLHCHYHVHIPSNPIFSSLNLAQSVQIIAYELRMKLLDPALEVTTRATTLANIEDIERFHAHLKDTLVMLEFLHPTHPKRLLQRLRRLFNRVQLEDVEVRLLRGILTQIQRLGRRSTP